MYFEVLTYLPSLVLSWSSEKKDQKKIDHVFGILIEFLLASSPDNHSQQLNAT